MMMMSVTQALNRTSFLKGQVPLLGEAFICQKRNSSIDHHVKYGTGRRNSFNGKIVTVFGATGFLGRYVVNRLAQSGSQIIIPYRGSEDDIRHIRLMGELGQIVFLNYDIRDYDSILKTLTHSNVAINLVGRNFPTRNFSMEDVHVGAAETIAQAAKDSNVDHLIHVSAINAKPGSESKFFQLKARGERAVTSILPSATIVRPAQCYGDEDKYLNLYAYLHKLRFVPLVGSGWETIKRPVLISDVAQGIVNAVKDTESIGKTYELYGPEEYYLHDMVQFIYRMTKKPCRIVPFPKAFYQIAGWFGEQTIFNPRLTRDMAIRQFLTEEIDEEAYGFEDLGITPVNFNRAALQVLRRHRSYHYHDQVLEEEEFCPSVSGGELQNI